MDFISNVAGLRCTNRLVLYVGIASARYNSSLPNPSSSSSSASIGRSSATWQMPHDRAHDWCMNACRRSGARRTTHDTRHTSRAAVAAAGWRTSIAATAGATMVEAWPRRPLAGRRPRARRPPGIWAWRGVGRGVRRAWLRVHSPIVLQYSHSLSSALLRHTVLLLWLSLSLQSPQARRQDWCMNCGCGGKRRPGVPPLGRHSRQRL